VRGREVRVVAMQWPKRSKHCVVKRLAICAERVNSLRPDSADIVCFPEGFLYAGLAYDHVSEVAAQCLPAIKHAQQWAVYLRSHIVLPVIYERQGSYTNSVLTFSRTGDVIGHYEKRYPWPSSLDKTELEKGICPGRGSGAVDTDLGRIGVQTCFDVNWPDGWEELRKQCAKLVLFPSEYGGGFALRSRAWQLRAPIIAVILGATCRVIDMTGDEATRKYSKSAGHMNIISLNTNKALVHVDHNEEGLQRLARYGSINLRRLSHDNVFLVEAPPSGEHIEDILHACGVRELSAYLSEARRIIESKRDRQDS
jgi:beta-ureidopropionase